MFVASTERVINMKRKPTVQMGKSNQELQLLQNQETSDRQLITAMMNLTKYSEENRSMEVYSALKDLVENGSDRVRHYAIMTLGKLGIKESLPTLIRASHDKAVQGSALHALRMIGIPHTHETPITAFQTGDDQAIREAILAVDESEDRRPEIREELQRIANSENDISARMAKRTLRKLYNHR